MKPLHFGFYFGRPALYDGTARPVAIGREDAEPILRQLVASKRTDGRRTTMIYLWLGVAIGATVAGLLVWWLT